MIVIIFACNLKFKKMLTKNTVIQSIDNLPNSFTIDELIEQLIFAKKIEDGIQQSDEGKTVSNDDVKSMIEKC